MTHSLIRDDTGNLPQLGEMEGLRILPCYLQQTETRTIGRNERHHAQKHMGYLSGVYLDHQYFDWYPVLLYLVSDPDYSKF